MPLMSFLCFFLCSLVFQEGRVRRWSRQREDGSSAPDSVQVRGTDSHLRRDQAQCRPPRAHAVSHNDHAHRTLASSAMVLVLTLVFLTVLLFVCVCAGAMRESRPPASTVTALRMSASALCSISAAGQCTPPRRASLPARPESVRTEAQPVLLPVSCVFSRCPVLVATDVASRGLDIPDVR